YPGLSAKELFARSALPQKVLQRSLDLLSTRGVALLVDKEKRHFLAAEVFKGMVNRSLALIADFHHREPMKEGLGKEQLHQRLAPGLEPRVFARVVAALIEGGKVEVTGESLRLKGKGRTLTLGDEAARTKLLGELSASGLAPPRVDELASRLALPATRVVELLSVALAQGLVARVTEDLYFDKKAVDALKDRLVAHLHQQKEISTQ